MDPNRPHVILAGDKAMFLAGYYEAPDDAEPKFLSTDYFLDRNAQYGCNTFRLPFNQENKSGPNNPYCPYSAWNNNDCGHAVWLSTVLPLEDMAPEERVDGFSADGYWFVNPGKCYAGYLSTQ